MRDANSGGCVMVLGIARGDWGLEVLLADLLRPCIYIGLVCVRVWSSPEIFHPRVGYAAVKLRAHVSGRTVAPCICGRRSAARI